MIVLDQSRNYAYDSRKISPGDGFICLPKGEAYIESALSNGATEVIHCTRLAFATAANDYFGNPTQRVTLIGVTGTNGKTSVCAFIQQLLEQLGRRVLVIGTLNSTLTTPEAWDSLAKIKAHADAGGTHVVMEVSSHGIDQYRVHGFDFDVKCLTNITQDHLDYHKTFDAYKKTKLHFMSHYPGISIYSDRIKIIQQDAIPQLMGQFHIQNVSLALAACHALGENISELQQKLSQLIAPKGRFQTVDLGQPFGVIVDFAHTPDALETVLKDALKQVGGNKDQLIVVFGCGGDRDQSKRKPMGRIAESYSQNIILTSDNSRSESSNEIMGQIATGVTNPSVIKAMEHDRSTAIALAITHASHGDIVVIAGKGHETMQHCNGYSYSFSDDQIAATEILRQERFQFTQTWAVDQSNQSVDVLFITKKAVQPMASYAQFNRCLKAPSNSKVKAYLSKIKGEKIVVIESSQRGKMSDMLCQYLREKGIGMWFNIDHEQPLINSLAGLTLIEQTNDPIIVKVNPSAGKWLATIASVINPQYIIVGDVYNDRGFIEASVINGLKSMCRTGDVHSKWWLFSQMADVIDAIEPIINPDQLTKVQAAYWMDYVMNVVKAILIKLNHPTSMDLFFQKLMAMSWAKKVTITGAHGPLYVVEWTHDIVDANQKQSYFQSNSDVIYHYITQKDNNDALIGELNYYGRNSNVIELSIVESSALNQTMATHINAHPESLHVLWVPAGLSIQQFEVNQ